jgi:hypothetical protein
MSATADLEQCVVTHCTNDGTETANVYMSKNNARSLKVCKRCNAAIMEGYYLLFVNSHNIRFVNSIDQIPDMVH